MGMETIEIVMELEDAFALEIPDADAERIQTIGDTVQYIARRLSERRRPGRIACTTAPSFYELRRELCVRFDVPRSRVRTTVKISDLIPREEDRHRWPSLAHVAGIPLPARTSIFSRRPKFPRPDTTIADLVRSKPADAFYLVDGSVDADAIFQRVRAIVAQVMGMSEDKIRREHFYVKDLGAG